MFEPLIALLTMVGVNLGMMLGALTLGSGLGLWRMRGWRRTAVATLVFGSVAILTQFVAYPVSPGVIIDGRAAIVGLTGLFLGWTAGLGVVVMAMSVRAIEGGPGFIAGLWVALSSLALGASLHRWTNPSAWRALWFAAFGIGLVLLSAVSTLLLPSGARNLIFSEIWVLSSASALVSFLIGVLIRDELRKISTHDTLAERLDRLRALMDAQPDLLLVLSKTGRYLEVHCYDEDMLVQSRAQLLSRTVRDVLPAAEAAAIMGVIERTLQTQAVVNHTYSLEVTQGLRHFEARVAPLAQLSAADEPTVLWISRDVTERHNLELRLRESEKLESIGRLAAGVAHDFNNLLMVIRGHTSLLLDDTLDEAIRDDVEQIDEAASRAGAMTAQLLALGRRQVVQPQRICFDHTLRSASPLLQRLMGEDVHLELVLGVGTGQIQMDPGQFNQVLLNLAANARDAMPNGGVLRMETSKVTIDGDPQVGALKDCPGITDRVECRPICSDLGVDFLEISKDISEIHDDEPGEAGGAPRRGVISGQAFSAGPYVKLVASDSGEGIDPAVLQHIFEPFYSTKGMEGTGLGLATVAGVLSQANGQISAENSLDAGAVFTLYLPWFEPMDGHICSAPKPLHIDVLEHGTILVAEDELPIRNVLHRILSRAGYTVLLSGSGEEAITIADAYQAPIDLLITDVVMTGMNGRALGDAMQLRRPGLPVLFVSGYDGGALTKRGICEGEYFLAKPFDGKTLRMAVLKARGLVDTMTPPPIIG